MRNFDKRSAFIVIALMTILVLMCLELWLKHHYISQTTSTNPRNFATQSTNGKTFSDLRYNSYGQISLHNQNLVDAVHEANERDRLDPKAAWKTPMNFFGKVTDEKDQPIEGATVEFLWTDLTPTGTTKISSISDRQGLFALEDVHGKRLTVNVNKIGYQTLRDQFLTSFEFADPADATSDEITGHKIIYYEPDSGHPFQFRLRKKGNPAFLIKKSLGFALHGDGRAKSVNFLTGLVTPLNVEEKTGQMEVNGWMPWPARPPVPHYDWRLLFSLPDGGFIKSKTEFEPTAPTAGYQPTLDVDMHATMSSDWRDGMEADYFFYVWNAAHIRPHAHSGHRS